MGEVVAFNGKESHFPIFSLKILIVPSKAGKMQEYRLRNGLLGIVCVGERKQEATIVVSRLVRH